MSPIMESDWTIAPLSTSVVPLDRLRPLTGNPKGNPIWKSNNPELIDGDGWLMQSDRRCETRGGSAFPLAGTFNIYLFHVNKSN
jgi:hypothetical protein